MLQAHNLTPSIYRTGVQTFRREHDRFWVIAAHPTLNLFAAGMCVMFSGGPLSCLVFMFVSAQACVEFLQHVIVVLTNCQHPAACQLNLGHFLFGMF